MNEKVLRLMQLAMEISQSGKAEAFCQYSGHVDGVHYWAHPTGLNYQGDKPVPYIADRVDIWLTHSDADTRLDIAIAQFESLLMGDAA